MLVETYDSMAQLLEPLGPLQGWTGLWTRRVSPNERLNFAYGNCGEEARP